MLIAGLNRACMCGRRWENKYEILTPLWLLVCHNEWLWQLTVHVVMCRLKPVNQYDLLLMYMNPLCHKGKQETWVRISYTVCVCVYMFDLLNRTCRNWSNLISFQISTTISSLSSQASNLRVCMCMSKIRILTTEQNCYFLKKYITLLSAANIAV